MVPNYDAHSTVVALMGESEISSVDIWGAVMPLTGKRRSEEDTCFVGKIMHFILDVRSRREASPRAGASVHVNC